MLCNNNEKFTKSAFWPLKISSGVCPMKREAGVSDDDLEGITSMPRKVEGVLVGVTFREKENGVFKISVRTHAPVDAAEICRKFGGGGHNRAAGCAVEGMTLEQAEKEFVRVIGEVL